MMFDGAVAATVNQAENAQPAADAASAATSDSKDSAHAGDGTQTQTDQAQHNQTDQADSHDDSSTQDVAVATDAPRKEVVFIDTSVTDYQSLVDNVPSGVEIELFDGSKDGLSQLVQWAQNHSGYDAIHILSHGGEGEVQLGTLTLDSATATARAADLATLGAALTESGDLLLYGCDVAENTGQSFVSLLAQLTGADIAASTDTTGASAQGGDWELESHTGLIETDTLHIDSYQHVLDVTGTTAEIQLGGTTVYTAQVGSGVEFFLDEAPDVNESNNYIDIDPVNSTITMTLRNGAYPNGLTSFDVVFSGGTLQAITSVTKDSGASNSVADISTSVNGNDKTITFHFNVNSEINNDGVLVWHFTSTNTGQDTAPTVSGTAINPTFTENGAAVTLFSSVAADTHDSGQTFTGAQFTVSNVAGTSEYLTIHGVNVALSNGNSVSLGSGYGTASVSVSSGLATITLSGATLSNADMSSLLSGMTYSNSSDNPGSATRTVTLTQLTDSGSSNNTVTTSISSAVTVVPVNDAPTEITLSNTVLTQSQGSNATVATLSTTDVDSTSFTYSLVSGNGSTDNALFTLSGNTLRVVDASTMSAGTYSIRLRTTDDGGVSYEKVVTFTVVDDIAPTYDQAPTISNPTSGGFTISGSVTEASTFYYVVVPDGASAPTATQVINGQNASGGFANASGYQILNTSPYDFSLALTGLAASTMYDVYVVAKDSAGNNTVNVVKMDATTASAGTAPSVSAAGSSPVFIGGMAGSVDLFAGVSANTNDSGQTFSSLTLTVSNVTDSGEFINVGGSNLSLSSNSFGSLAGLGNFSIIRSGNTAIIQLSGMNASNDQLAGLIDGLRYGNSSESVTSGTRTVTLASVSDNGTSNNTTSLSINASVNVLASNSALYVTSGNDTGADATFGNSIQDDVNDGGGLSLREALYWANNTSGVNRIVFQTDVTLASSIITPTQTMLIDGQSFTLNGGGYSGFQITTSSMTFAVQNLTLTNFSTANNTYTAGIIGLSYDASNVNLRLYNVDISGNRDDVGFGNGMIDLYNIAPGSYVFDLDRVNIHDNTLFGGYNDEGVIKLFVSGAQQTVNLSITNSSISNNTGINPVAGNTGIIGLYVMANTGVAPATNITLMNSTITGQDAGIIFSFTNNAASWVASVRNSIISGNTIDLGTLQNHTTGTYTINGANNLIGSGVNFASATDPRLAATAANAINQGSQFYVTGDSDIRGLDRTRQGTVDIGAYESQFASGAAPQVDLNGSNSGVDYSAGVSTGLSNGVAITDSLATLSQTDGDSRIWTMTLALSGVQDSGSESLTLSSSARLAAHAAGITVTSDGQTLTLTGGATVEAFQTVLRAIMFVNVATTPTAGTRTISVTVNDDASSTATSSLTIAAGNPPVVSTPVPAQSIAQNGSLSFMVPAGTFTDPDGDTLTLSATLADGSALPGWLTFNAATGTFSGTPGNGDVGVLSIKITATDATSNTVNTTFSLTVTNVNDAPVVTRSLPAQAMLQGQSLSFTVPAGTFSDPDGDTLTLSATLADGSALPTWLTFNPTTGTFSGTPGNADVGHLSIKVTATDPDNASASTPYELFVLNVNDAPEVATPIPAQSIAQNSSLSFTVPAGTFSDPDGDTLTLSATLADGSALPAWLTFNASTGTFSGTPGNADVGSLSIKITANDWDASVSTTFTLTVTNVNDAPVVAMPVPAQGVLQDYSLSFTVPAGTFSDPDGDPLTLSATLADGSALPTWLTFNAATGTFSGTPGNADVGNISIKITATDPGNASASATFDLFVVNVNDAPVVATSIPPQSVAQDSVLSFVVPPGTFSDPDGDFLTLSATLADGSALPVWLTFNASTGTFSGTPGSLDLGNLSIKVTASDGDASVSTTFTLSVVLPNDAPVVSGSVPPQSVAQDGSFSLVVPQGTFTDPDGDTLTLSATLADGSPLPTWLTFNPATGTFSGTPGNGDVGNLSIKLTATDPGNASVSTTFALIVTNVNDAPIVGATIAPQSIAQDSGLNFTVPAGTFIDPDGDTLTLSATLADGSPLPAWLTFNPATGTFSGTPGNADVGLIGIKLTATDPDNAAVSTTFALIVTNVNDAPVVGAPIPPQSIPQDGSLNFTLPAGTFVDPDGDTLTLTATLTDGSPLPGWLTFNPATGTFSGTPGNGDVGNISIKVTANDGDASVSTTFALTVVNVNDAPVVSGSIPPQSVAQDGSFSFTVPAGTFVDPDGDTLTLSATLADGSPLPGWLTFNPANGTFSGTPGNADVGNISIKITASDGSTSVSTSFGLTVSNVNDAPVVGVPLPPQSVAQDGSFSFTVPAGTFVDPDGDTLTLTATLADGSPLPAWLTFNPATGTFSGTPGNGDVGNISIRVTANDGDASVSTTFALTVVNVNDAPVVSGSIPPQSVAQDGSFSFTVPAGTFVDPDGDTLTLSATLADGSPLPAWLTFNPATGTFSGTPGNADVGNISIKITASDGSTSVSTSFGLTVSNVNDAPVVGVPIPPQSIPQDGSLNFTLPAGTFVDPDGDTLTLTATLTDGSPLPGWLTFNPATGTFSGTPGNGDVGNISIKVTANDGDASVSTTFALTVVNVNDAPVVGAPIPPQSIAQDGSFIFTVPAGTFVDADGDALALTATLADGSPLPAWLSFNPATGTFSGTPGNADVGNITIRITASDGSTSVSTSFGLTVSNVNDAPVVGAPIPPQSIPQDGSLNFTLPAGTFVDPDGDTLTLTATLADGSPLPAWLSFNPATGTFSGTPGNGDVGNISIKVTANDGDASVSTTFALTVVNVNDAPVVSGSIPPQSVAQDGSFSFTVPAGTFVDPDGDTLTLSTTLADGSALPAWLSFNPATGTFSGTPGNADVGNISIRVTASDGSTSASTSFGLTVSNVNDAPVVGAPIPPQSIAQGGGLNFTLPAGTFVDPDGDTLTLSATLADGSALPAWLSFNPATGTFSGTPGNANIGSLTIRVTATDGDNTSVSTTFGLTVTRAGLTGGDPQFRLSDGNGPQIPGSSNAPFFGPFGANVPAPEPLFASQTLGSFTAGRSAADTSVLASVFASSRNDLSARDASTSQTASLFGRGAELGNGANFDSALGSFPSFNKDPALGGTSSLASVFSGIYLPSLNTMEVFSSGSWKGIMLTNQPGAFDVSGESAAAFMPSLHQQLQHIGEAEGQRLSAIEQALHESGQQQG